MRTGALAGAPATLGIAGVTAAVSLLVLATGALPFAALLAGFMPLRAEGLVLPPVHGTPVPVWLTPLSAALVHGGIAHLLVNMVALLFCGVMVERALGSAPALVLYLLGAYAAAAGQWLMTPGSPVPVIGASGAISAWVAAYALLYGQGRARAVGPVPARVVNALWLASAWTGIQLLVGTVGLGDAGPIAVGAHLGGFAAGLVLARPLLLWRYRGA